jgi:hypothetical protein
MVRVRCRVKLLELAGSLATLALLLGFWYPPILIGRWAGDRELRVGVAPIHPAALVGLTALAWTASWLVLNVLLLPACVPQAPSDPCDAPGFIVLGFAFMAVLVVLPVSALVCSSARRSRLRRRSSEPVVHA